MIAIIEKIKEFFHSDESPHPPACTMCNVDDPVECANCNPYELQRLREEEIRNCN
jgi:hypothetical protein